MSREYSQPTPARRRGASFLLRLALVGVGLAIALVIAEGLCRALLSERLDVVTDERNLLYRFDPELGWFPRPSTQQRFLGERWIDVRHNSIGLRDVEVPPKAPGRPRILFFGDSFVWGYDAQVDERFTDLLRQRNPDWDIINCGVSGYGTDQALLLLRRLGPSLAPDVVVLAFNRGDRNDNQLGVNLGGYAKPLFLLDKGTLSLTNVPVPMLNKARWGESALYRHSYAWRLVLGAGTPRPIPVMLDPTEHLVDMMQQESANLGAKFLLILEEPDAKMMAHVEDAGIPVVAIEPAFQAVPASPGDPLRYTGHGAHWTPWGHRVVADTVGPALRRLL